MSDTPAPTPVRDRPAVRYQRFIAMAFLVAVTLMLTQYAVVTYGPAKVLITPFAMSGPEAFAEKPVDQDPGLYVINWRVLDECFYKLQGGRFWPPAEGLVALCFLLALPLLLGYGWRRQVWPRYPLFALVAVGLASCLSAEHFRAAVMENAQLILTVLVTVWLAAVAVVDGEQMKRLNRWLAILTVFLLLYAGYDYWRYILQPPVGAENPLAVRATCASRTAFSGLMLMLLCLGFGRVLASGNFGAIFGWGVLCLIGAARMMNGGAVIALVVAWIAMATVKGRLPGFIAGLILIPAAVGGSLYLASEHHLEALQDSLAIYRTVDGVPVGVEKRFLEMQAVLNGLVMTEDVTGPEDESGGRPVLGTRSNLLFGVGAGQNYQLAIGGYYRSLDNPEKQEPDTYNLYFLLALQMGLLAALIWAWILLDGAAVAREAFDRQTEPGLRMLALGIYGACIGILVFSLFGTILVRGTGLLLFTLLGVVYRLHKLTVTPVVAAAETPAEPAAVEARPHPGADAGTLPEGEGVETVGPAAAVTPDPVAESGGRLSRQRDVPSDDSEVEAWLAEQERLAEETPTEPAVSQDTEAWLQSAEAEPEAAAPESELPSPGETEQWLREQGLLDEGTEPSTPPEAGAKPPIDADDEDETSAGR